MNANDLKRRGAAVFDVFGVNALGFAIQKAALSPFVRVVNYHDIPAEHAQNFESHLEFYSERFENVNEKSLRAFLADGKWPHVKPGLIISFDDGMRSHFERAAPMLEKYGFTGWFFVPAGWVAERIDGNAEVVSQIGDQQTLTVEQLRYLAAKHVVGCHTETHCRLSADLSADKMRYETADAKRSFTEMLGRNTDIFCWVGGEEFTYSKAASDLIRQNYDLGFMTNNAVVRRGTDPMQIQRTNIEAENPLSLVRFQLSGILDLIYAGKRRRVNFLTKASR
jgi:peptidoglycan/xylan/chitin deacetylase (PgdA/CDA1 family)